MFLRKSLVIAALPLVLLAGCSNPIGPGFNKKTIAVQGSPQQAMQGLLEAVEAKDAAKAASYYATGATVYVAETAPVTDIAARFDEGFNNPGYKVVEDPASTKFFGGGTVAIFRTNAKWTFNDGGSLVTYDMANIMVWEKDATTREWKVTSDFTAVPVGSGQPGLTPGNPDEPPPAPGSSFTPLSNPIGPGIPKIRAADLGG
ncbi:DUF4440 domain-containing protein [Altererythrobacter salegens]|uniref:DUF4440 domain-containing protein n=1 Tax=Croceibacterium salegens TaxID=1737568 RepID=A0A6I4SW02_9SPHN|nr:nuclear transport factor 2 family protein [Croceibacterium salegens]MXO59230.1 DUF4440 domain-containing protein [Croceibacterium salegens]